MEKISVCKVGAALFLSSPSFTPLDHSTYFLILKIRHKETLQNLALIPLLFQKDSPYKVNVYRCTFGPVLQNQLPPPWMHLGSLGKFQQRNDF